MGLYANYKAFTLKNDPENIVTHFTDAQLIQRKVNVPQPINKFSEEVTDVLQETVSWICDSKRLSVECFLTDFTF
jgi:hypothetical protein